MIDVYVNGTNELVGSITDADLKVLVDALEEESSEDQTTGSTKPLSTCWAMDERPSIS